MHAELGIVLQEEAWRQLRVVLSKKEWFPARGAKIFVELGDRGLVGEGNARTHDLRAVTVERLEIPHSEVDDDDEMRRSDLRMTKTAVDLEPSSFSHGVRGASFDFSKDDTV